jgi:hypothetical protein
MLKEISPSSHQKKEEFSIFLKTGSFFILKKVAKRNLQLLMKKGMNWFPLNIRISIPLVEQRTYYCFRQRKAVYDYNGKLIIPDSDKIGFPEKAFFVLKDKNGSCTILTKAAQRRI